MSVPSEALEATAFNSLSGEFPIPQPAQPALITRAAGRARRLGVSVLRSLRPSSSWAWAWPVPLALLLLWELAARAGWVPSQVLPAPSLVGQTLAQLAYSGELWDHLSISLVRVAAGFALGLAGGLALGTALGLSPLLRDYVYPGFKALSQVPALGWLPFLMLLVGLDETLKFLLIAKATLVPVTLNTCEGIRGVPQRFVEVARVFGFSRWQLLSRVVFPAAAAPIWSGVRYGLTHAWLALVVVELLASSEGIGFLVVYGRQLFQLDVVLAAVAVIGALGFLLDKALARTEAQVLAWRKPGL